MDSGSEKLMMSKDDDSDENDDLYDFSLMMMMIASVNEVGNVVVSRSGFYFLMQLIIYYLT